MDIEKSTQDVSILDDDTGLDTSVTPPTGTLPPSPGLLLTRTILTSPEGTNVGLLGDALKTTGIVTITAAVPPANRVNQFSSTITPEGGSGTLLAYTTITGSLTNVENWFFSADAVNGEVVFKVNGTIKDQIHLTQSTNKEQNTFGINSPLPVNPGSTITIEFLNLGANRKISGGFNAFLSGV